MSPSDMARVTVYTSFVCAYCVAAKSLLRRLGVDFEEVDLMTHPGRRDEMLRRTKGRRSVPQIFIDDVGVGGFEDLRRLAQNGELDRRLGREEC